jgi:hypothetical protein
MENLIRIKNLPGPSLCDFCEKIFIAGYVIVANVFTWYVLPEMLFLTNPFVIGLGVLFPVGGMLFGGMKGCARGALILPGSIVFINAAFFPFYLLWWLGGLSGAYLTTMAFPVFGNVFMFVAFLILILIILFTGLMGITEYRYKKNLVPSDESEDYKSPSFSMTPRGWEMGLMFRIFISPVITGLPVNAVKPKCQLQVTDNSGSEQRK